MPAFTSSITRRTFLKRTGQASVALPGVLSAISRAKAEQPKLRHVSIGAGNMPGRDVRELSQHPQFELVAFADVDETQTKQMREMFPRARYYRDWRELFEKEHENFDSCNIGTPDHMHASVTMTALRQDKHVYCQKPLCQRLGETRQVMEEAEQRDVVTQMGIQRQSSVGLRMTVQLLQDGVIGKVHTVHTWSNKEWGRKEPVEGSDSVPEHLSWDYWLGVAAERPYVEGVYHPRRWREWQDFGTGNFGDMGCHIYDPVYRGLGLSPPVEVRSFGPEPSKEGWPEESQFEFRCEPTEFTTDDGLTMTWQDGGRMPPDSAREQLGDYNLPNQGALFIGTEGRIVLPLHGGPRLFPREKFRDHERPDLDKRSHWHQFIDAALGNGGQTTASFDYAAPLTEAVLLTTVASRFREQTLRWDSNNLRFPNMSDANQYLHRQYREGWDVAGLGST